MDPTDSWGTLNTRVVAAKGARGARVGGGVSVVSLAQQYLRETATRHVRTATHRRTHPRGAWQPPHPAQTQSSRAWQRSAAMCWSSSVVRNRQDFKTCRISPRLNLAFCSPSKLDDTIHCSQTVGFVSMSYEAGRNPACLEILTKDRSSLSSPAFRCSLLRRLGAAPAAGTAEGISITRISLVSTHTLCSLPCAAPKGYD